MSLRDCSAPRGVFPGVNFMTPEVLGYYKLREGYAELSRGRGMSGQPIFGVTVRNGAGADPMRQSKLFQSVIDARDYIEGLS